MSGGCQSSRGHYIRGRLAKTTTRLLLLRAKGTSLRMQTADGPRNRATLCPSLSLQRHEPEPCQRRRQTGFVDINSLRQTDVAKRPGSCGVSPR